VIGGGGAKLKIWRPRRAAVGYVGGGAAARSVFL